MRGAVKASTAHARLGPAFYDEVDAARFAQAVLRWRNDRWAARVGLDGLTDTSWIGHFGRFEPIPGSFPRPLALRYHGHQFRNYNPDLGDGRGFLFAQLRDAGDGRLLDLGTKGSGQTPWSRTGDGRLTLKGGVREVLATLMLEAQGVDTSKSFSLVETGEALQRQDEPSPTRGAVLVRLNHSHIRIGSFQRLAYLGETEELRRLLEVHGFRIREVFYTSFYIEDLLFLPLALLVYPFQWLYVRWLRNSASQQLRHQLFGWRSLLYRHYVMVGEKTAE